MDFNFTKHFHKLLVPKSIKSNDYSVLIRKATTISAILIDYDALIDIIGNASKTTSNQIDPDAVRDVILPRGSYDYSVYQRIWEAIVQERGANDARARMANTHMAITYYDTPAGYADIRVFNVERSSKHTTAIGEMQFTAEGRMQSHTNYGETAETDDENNRRILEIAFDAA